MVSHSPHTAKGPQFEIGREQSVYFSQSFNLLSVEEDLNTTKALRPRGKKTVAKAVVDAKMKFLRIPAGDWKKNS